MLRENKAKIGSLPRESIQSSVEPLEFYGVLQSLVAYWAQESRRGLAEFRGGLLERIEPSEQASILRCQSSFKSSKELLAPFELVAAQGDFVGGFKT